MYEDVIKLVKTNMETCLEGEIMQAVMRVGVEVNKEELIRALAYDRGQYEKGYRDGMEDAVVHARWIRQDNTYTRYQCSVCEAKNYGMKCSFCPNCGAKMDE